jgi:hypothetical protein
MREVDFAHPAGADPRDDTVMTNACSAREIHLLASLGKSACYPTLAGMAIGRGFGEKDAALAELADVFFLGYRTLKG